MYKKCEEILNKLESEGKIKISNYQFPQPQELKLKLKDMLEDEVDEKYYLSKQAIYGRLTTNYERYNIQNHLVNNWDVHQTILSRYDGAPSLYIPNEEDFLRIKEATKYKDKI